MSKYNLTDEDKKIIKVQQDASTIVRFLRTKDSLGFGVGDYLIKVHKRGTPEDPKWEPEVISGVSNQPKRFLCVHEDEYGIKYIKPLTSLGKELPYITPVTEMNDWTRYQVDPEFAEHIILNDENEFDFSAKYKQDKARRDAITRKNKKIAKKINNIAEADKLLSSLSIGDKIWFGYSIPDAVECCWSILDIKKRPVRPNYYDQDGRNTTYEVTLQQEQPIPRFSSAIISHGFASENFINAVVMLTEPFKYETI